MSPGMAVHVEPQPLHEPLAGGTPGATVTVEPMIAGHVDFPAAAMVKPRRQLHHAEAAAGAHARQARRTIPVPAFLIRHPSAGAILVDTGLHPSIATDGKENFGGSATASASRSLSPGEDVPAQLRARGLDPGEIPIVRDDPPPPRPHLGDLRVPELDLRRQRARVEGGGARLRDRCSTATAAPTSTTPSTTARSTSTAAAIDSYASFGRTFDLFGDGSVRLAFTPGHSAGHMSVIARLANATS